VDLRRIVRDDHDREPLPQTQQLLEHLAVVDRAARRRVPRPRVDELPIAVDADQRHRVPGDGAVEREHTHPTRVGGGRGVRRVDAGVERGDRERLLAGRVPAQPLALKAARVPRALPLGLPRELGHRLQRRQVQRRHIVELAGGSLLFQLEEGTARVQWRRDHEKHPERPELGEWWRQRIEHRRQ
jgi:hypothetical protein